MGSLVLAGQLQQLLLTALSDGSTYSALVPWILDSDRKGLPLCQYAQERQCLEHLQFQAGHARPRDMQQVVLRVAGRCCQHAAALQNDACTPAEAPGTPAATPPHEAQQHKQQGSSRPQQQGSRQPAPSSSSSKGNSSSGCSLTQPASRLAKLHGHLLCHLAAPDLVGQLQQLLLLLTAGPLDCSSTRGRNSSGGSKGSGGSGQHSTAKQPSRSKLDGHKPASAPAGAAHPTDQQQQGQGCQLQEGAGSLQPPSLPCRGCAARYAGKALECCGRLLALMPLEVLQALIISPHLQHYSPALASTLGKACAAAGAGAGAGPAAHSTPAAHSAAAAAAAAHHSTPWQQQQQQPGDAQLLDNGCTPGLSSRATATAGVLHSWTPASTPASFGSAGAAAAVAARLADTPSSSKGKAVSTHRTPTATGRLSGLGLLLPTAPGSGLPSRPASAGQLPAGGKAAKTAAVCNREKSRDTFFSILRRASGRLDALRAAQHTAAAEAEAAAGGVAGDSASNSCQQSGLAEAQAAAAAGLAELLCEVSVSSKQLLLQLAPSNLPYLAELFMACVLQAASTGEPLLEPALALMAEKDPGRFMKLQQRLADRTAGPPAAAAATSSSSPTSLVPTRQHAGTTPGSRGSSRQAAARGAAGTSKQQSTQHSGRAAGPGHLGGNGSSSSSSGLCSASRADGTTALQHRQARSHARSSQQQQQQRVMQAAAGVAALQPQAPGAHQGSVPGPVPRRLAPQRDHNPAGQAAVAGAAAASSPVPAALLGAADSPLPASCLSSLFAAASSTPLPTPQVATAARAAAGGGHDAGVNAVAGVASPCRLSNNSAAGGDAGACTASGAVAQVEQHTQQQHDTGLTAVATAPQTAVAMRKPPAAAALAAASGPHSAPPKLQAGPLPLSSSSSTPGPAAAAAALAQAGSGPAQVLLQVLPLLPPGQHVLLLLLHAADSSSLNRALLGVMSARVQQLLSGSSGSFTAASGLGQQAAAVAALGSFCSYLCFAAGATEAPPGAAAAPAAVAKSGGLGTLLEGPGAGASVLLQQQPLLDIPALLQQLLDGPHLSHSSDGQQQGNSSGCELDRAWQVALAVPFAVSFMQLAELNPLAAVSSSVRAALGVFEAIRQLPALDPTSSGFGALPACIGCCIQGCQQLLQQQLQQVQQEGGEGAWSARGDSIPGASGSRGCSELSKALAAGSCLVDSSYWAICCPGLQQLVAILDTATVAAAAAPAAASTPTGVSPRQSCAGRANTQHPQPWQQLQLANGTGGRAGPAHTPSQRSPAAAAPPEAAASTRKQPSQAAEEAASGDRTAAAAAEVCAANGPSAAAAAGPAGANSSSNRPQSSSGGSPANAASTHYTTPLLLAPRNPTPVVDVPPESVVAALSAVSHPVRQRLQQAFISQYSTDDNPVKMRDVLTVINGILFANSLARGLSSGVPAVLQKHLALMQQAVQQQLAPGATAAAAGGGGGPCGSSTQLQGQELARAVHALYSSQLSAALPEALDAAMQAAADHACTAAAAACGALLPADVPPAAASTAAALVTASCKASCAQRLMQEVPVLVQSTLADAADDLVRLVNRQWAVHTRMTAAAGAGTGAGAAAPPPAAGPSLGLRSSSSSSGGGGSASGGASGEAGKEPARLQPVKLQAAAQVTPVMHVGNGAAAAGPVGTALEDTSAAPAVAATPAAAAAVPTPSRGSSISSKTDRPAALPAAAPAEVRSAPTAHTPAAEETAGPATDTAQAGQLRSSDTAAAAAGRAAAVVSSFLSGSLLKARAQASQHQGLDQLPAPAVLLEVMADAELAAQQLVGGVVRGRCSMAAVEAELMQALRTAQHDQATTQAGMAAASAAGSVGNSIVVAPGDRPGDRPAALQQQQLLRQHLVLLLSAALIKTLLSCPELKAAVWGSRSLAAGAGAAGAQADAPVTQHQGLVAAQPSVCRAEVLPHLTQLPALVMKACRADGVPVWLLRQLRQWLQAATLWCQPADV